MLRVILYQCYCLSAPPTASFLSCSPSPCLPPFLCFSLFLSTSLHFILVGSHSPFCPPCSCGCSCRAWTLLAFKEKGPPQAADLFFFLFPPTGSSIRVLLVHFLSAAQTKPPMSWADALLGAPGFFFSPSCKSWSSLLSSGKMHLAPNYIFETFICGIMSEDVKIDIFELQRSTLEISRSHFWTNLFHIIMSELLSWHDFQVS